MFLFEEEFLDSLLCFEDKVPSLAGPLPETKGSRKFQVSQVAHLMPRAANKRDLAGESATQLEALLVRQDKRYVWLSSPAPRPWLSHAPTHARCARTHVRSRKSRKLSASDGRKKQLDPSACGTLTVQAEDAADGGPGMEMKAEEVTWEDVEETHEGDGASGSGVVVALSREDAEPQPKKKRRGPTFNKQDRALCREIHRTHLLFLLARGMALSGAADELILQSVALSLVPPNVDVGDREAMLQLLREGFRGAVRPVVGDMEGFDGNVLARLAEGTDVNGEQLAVLSAALLRGVGVPARIIWAMDPAPLRPEDVVKHLKAKEAAEKKNNAKNTKEEGSERDEGSGPAGRVEASKEEVEERVEKKTKMRVTKKEANQRKKGKTEDIDGQDKTEGVREPVRSLTSARHWLEVYSPEKECWETLHLIPPPSQMIEPYVTAFNGRGAKDLTIKYCAQEHLARLTPQRDEAWWTRTVAPHRRAETAALREQLERHMMDDEKNAEALVAKASELEDGSIVAKEDHARREVPTTIKGFQKHEQFILKRHFKTHEVLSPGSEAVGMLKGEPFYNRSDVCVVHTAEKWKRQGRIVREDELSKPVKLIKKRGVQQVEADLEYLDPSTSQQLMSSFYGPWQTDVWQMPSAKDGIVPKNEWGSVEIPPLGHALPGGTVHVDLPDASKVCRRLGIDFADAVNGFEFKKRRMIPTKCGVVVCKENEGLLRNAWSEYVRHERQVAKEKRLAEGEAAWRDLLTAALTHIRVHRSFADDVEVALLEHASMKKDIMTKTTKNKGGSAGRKKAGDGEGLTLPEDNLVSDEIEEI